MATSLPPPQAYTRDILAAAYEWLRSQPQSIRELATNSDHLVALYLQSKRRGATVIPSTLPTVTEVSSETFKQDLRALAEGFKQFEQAPGVSPAPVQPSVTVQPTTPPLSVQNIPTPTQSLDARTLEMLRKTQSLCNLGSEREALRMLVVLGYERIRELFPRET